MRLKQKYNFIPVSINQNKEYDIINSSYKIRKMADVPHLSVGRGFDIEVLGSESNDIFEVPYHTYVYNYGKSSSYFSWKYDGDNYRKLLEPGDSIYVQPFIRYSIGNRDKINNKIITIEVPTNINESTQIELSYFLNNNRITNETERWF